jgi:hypothetical protein
MEGRGGDGVDALYRLIEHHLTDSPSRPRSGPCSPHWPGTVFSVMVSLEFGSDGWNQPAVNADIGHSYRHYRRSITAGCLVPAFVGAYRA